MEKVTVMFTNGNVVNFAAQEFDADLRSDRSAVNKYPYKDAEGQDSAIHVKPGQVAGVFVTPSQELGRGEPPITFKVAHSP